MNTYGELTKSSAISPYCFMEENNMDPDQTAPRKKLIWPSTGPISFAIYMLPKNICGREE